MHQRDDLNIIIRKQPKTTSPVRQLKFALPLNVGRPGLPMLTLWEVESISVDNVRKVFGTKDSTLTSMIERLS